MHGQQNSQNPLNRFAIPSSAGLIGLLLRQILLHVLIPSDLVHTTTYVDSRDRNNTTGIDIKASILHSTHPYRGERALQTISTVFFFIDMALFSIFSFVLLLRLIWFRRSACREAFGPDHYHDDHAISNIAIHPPKHKTNPSANDTVYLSLWPISWLTLVAFAVSIIPEINADPSSNISPKKLTYLAYITWWIGAAWTTTTTLTTFAVVIIPPSSPPNHTHNRQHIQRISPSLLIPPFALATTAVIGSLLTTNLLIASQPPSSSPPTNNNPPPALSPPNLAIIPVLIFSFCAIGAALFLATTLFPILLFQQLFTPTPGRDIHTHHPTTCTHLALTLFFFLGPLSQCAAALQLMGGALSAIPGAAFLTNTAPTLTSVPCILLALLLLGMASVWFLLALVAMGCAVFRRELRWGMDWHAVVLALAALGLSTLMFGAELDSGFFRVVACVLLVVVVVGFCVNVGLTGWFVVRRMCG